MHYITADIFWVIAYKVYLIKDKISLLILVNSNKEEKATDDAWNSL
jgi:hypothetical protein